MSALNASPWARDALTVDEAVGVEARAAALGAHVTVTAAHPGGPFVIHVSDRAVRVNRWKVTHLLAAAIHEALDEFRVQREAVDADVARYTPEEVLTIAAQSGLVRHG